MGAVLVSLLLTMTSSSYRKGQEFMFNGIETTKSWVMLFLSLVQKHLYLLMRAL